MQRYEREEIPKLRAAGIEARIIVFARPDREGLAQSTAAERATVAELWLTRDWTLYQRWTATPSATGPPLAFPPPTAIWRAGPWLRPDAPSSPDWPPISGRRGCRSRYPLIIWRDRAGFMKACACADSRSWVFVRDDLDAPDRIEGPNGDAADGDPAPLIYPGDGGPESLPYPTLPPIAPADGAAAPATPRAFAMPAGDAARAPQGARGETVRRHDLLSERDGRSERPPAGGDQPFDVRLVLIQAKAETDHIVAHVCDHTHVQQPRSPDLGVVMPEGQEAGSPGVAGDGIDQRRPCPAVPPRRPATAS
jgi:hypothetical protein